MSPSSIQPTGLQRFSAATVVAAAVVVEAVHVVANATWLFQNFTGCRTNAADTVAGLWLAGNEGMEENMETTIMGYMSYRLNLGWGGPIKEYTTNLINLILGSYRDYYKDPFQRPGRGLNK